MRDHSVQICSGHTALTDLHLSFTASSRHALPLFTSLLNVVCAYDPVGYGIPYNHLLFSDQREQLVEQAVQILIVTLEHEAGSAASATLQALDGSASPSAVEEQQVRLFFKIIIETMILSQISKYSFVFFQPAEPDNLFVNYLSRIHREEVL